MMILLSLLLAGCPSPRLDVDLSPDALRRARQDATTRVVHLDGAGVDLIAGRYAELDLIEGSPLGPALEQAIAGGWDVALSAQSPIHHGELAGAQRGATWRGATLIDPPEPGSSALWTLDVGAEGPSFYRGDPVADAPGRRFAIGGLEAVAAAGKDEIAPWLSNEILLRGAEERRSGRTYLAIDRAAGVLAVAVVRQGATGPKLNELADSLRAAGYDDVALLQGGAAASLVRRRDDGSVSVESTGDSAIPSRFGVAVRWKR